jgi:hypothetical protein
MAIQAAIQRNQAHRVAIGWYVEPQTHRLGIGAARNMSGM